MPIWFPFPIALAFILSASFAPLIIFVANKLHIVDEPTGGRKIHRVPTPLLGGLGIFIAFVLPTLLVLLFSDHLTNGEIGYVQFIGFFLGGLVLMIGGVFDDKFGLSPRHSVIFPILAALIASFAGIGVSKVTNPFGEAIIVSSSVSACITYLWLFSMSYATKLLDGVDGLTTSVGAVGSLVIAALALFKAFFQPDVALLALTFAAALFGFLLWNFPTARIFLGEGGSTFLGFSLGVLSIIAGSKMITLLLVLGIPCLDVLQVIDRRLKDGRPITGGGRDHLHHLLFDAGFSERKIIGLYVAFSVLFGLTTLLFSNFEKLLALVVLSIIFLFITRALIKHPKKL